MGEEDGTSVNIDTVMFNTHANPLGLGNSDSTYLSVSENKSILEPKTMKNMILLGCNAGHLDYKTVNLASQFAEITNSAPVLASDGTVSCRSLFGNYKSKNDKGFKNWRTDKRKNKGWTVYRSNSLGVSQVINSYGKNLMLIK